MMIGTNELAANTLEILKGEHTSWVGTVGCACDAWIQTQSVEIRKQAEHVYSWVLSFVRKEKISVLEVNTPLWLSAVYRCMGVGDLNGLLYVFAPSGNVPGPSAVGEIYIEMKKIP